MNLQMVEQHGRLSLTGLQMFTRDQRYGFQTRKSNVGIFGNDEMVFILHQVYPELLLHREIRFNVTQFSFQLLLHNWSYRGRNLVGLYLQELRIMGQIILVELVQVSKS